MAGLEEIDLEQFGLPISNTQNKLLEAKVQKNQKELSAHEVKINQHKERIQAVGDHLRNVKQELQHTQVPSSSIRHNGRSTLVTYFSLAIHRSFCAL